MSAVSVVRIVAPNAGVMTLDGTNSYVIGDATGCVVVDPGPPEPGHVAALRAVVTDRPFVAIVLTHQHVDHSEGAEAFARPAGSSLRSEATGELTEGTVLPQELVVLHT